MHEVANKCVGLISVFRIPEKMRLSRMPLV